MIIGVPKEIKNNEFRIGITPSGVRELTELGHTVLVQTAGGEKIGFSDQLYVNSGAQMIKTAAEIFEASELIVKVKEPQVQECEMLREGQALFTYLHLAADPKQTKLLVESQVIAIAYETVTDSNGRLPLLAPMSEVAGRMAAYAGANCLQITQGGNGTLMGGVPGADAANVLVIGGGVVGMNAARMAVGMGANVTVIDTSLSRLRELDLIFKTSARILYASSEVLEKELYSADLVIGAVLVPGAAAPKVVTRAMLKHMKQRAVVVDVAIDQGGCFETSRPTTHQNPTYSVDDVLHYCVANMPGAVARTSTIALTNATLPYVAALAEKGVKKALEDDPNLMNGLNICKGEVCCKAIAELFGYPCMDGKNCL